MFDSLCISSTRYDIGSPSPLFLQEYSDTGGDQNLASAAVISENGAYAAVVFWGNGTAATPSVVPTVALYSKV